MLSLKHFQLSVYNSIMWTLDQLITFKSVADTSNFSKTAKLLHISTAAVGKQIKTLEAEVGAQLFYRTTRQVKLTETGKAFLEHSKSILNEIDKTQEFLAAQGREIKGKIRIYSSIVFGETYILPNLHELLTLYPKLILDLELSDRIPNMETEGIDLLVGLMAGLPDHYTCRRIKDIRYVFCASPNYLKQFGIPKKPQDLETHHFITHSQRPNPYSVTFDKGIAVQLKPRVFTNNSLAMVKCCLDGLGIGMFHFDNVREYIQDQKLVEILSSYKQPENSLYLYFKTVQYIQPKLRCFIDFLIDKTSEKKFIA